MPVGFWGEMGVAHEIFPEGELFREVEFFGNLFDEQVGLVKQVFGLVDGEMGNPVGRRFPGTRLDDVGEVAGGQAGFFSIEGN